MIVVVKRLGLGGGDLAMLLRAIELLRLQHPTWNIVVWCRYPKLLENHPAIDEVLDSGRKLPEHDFLIDADNLLHRTDRGKHELFCERVSEGLEANGHGGIEWDGLPQTLWVSKELRQWAENFVSNAADGRVPVGLFWRSHEKWRTWKGMPKVVQKLTENGCAVFCFDSSHRLPSIDGVHQVVGYSLDKVNAIVSCMRVVVANDSLGAHVAGGLGIPLVAVFGASDPLLVISMYRNAKWVPVKCSKHPCWRSYCPTVSCLRRLKPQDVVDYVEAQVTGKKLRKKKYRVGTTALMRLDGIGGTLTLSDQAKKVKDKFGGYVAVIVRHHGQIFEGNPYVDDVIMVGLKSWEDCTEENRKRFERLLDIRFAVAKWYGKGSYRQNFIPWEKYYKKDYPLHQNELERYGMHHVRVTDMIAGLPCDNIDSKIYFSVPDRVIDSDYIVVTNGVDAVHKGLTQPKCWPHWNALVQQLDEVVVQVGTDYDTPVRGAVDLRGKTDLKRLASVLVHAQTIIVTEGGIMHMAYALGCENVIVLRGPTVSKLFEYPGHVSVDAHVCCGCFFTTKDWFVRCAREMVDPICMKSISAERVRVVYENLVENRSSRQAQLDNRLESPAESLIRIGA